ncbi:hypothetical protein, partial [Aromatoleum aromaticum]|uniref:hypothetical protein n=1 Tax=Aromatoleum aromaticum TaxID=551760 RepID=UPI001B7D1B55
MHLVKRSILPGVPGVENATPGRLKPAPALGLRHRAGGAGGCSYLSSEKRKGREREEEGRVVEEFSLPTPGTPGNRAETRAVT